MEIDYSNRHAKYSTADSGYGVFNKGFYIEMNYML